MTVSDATPDRALARLRRFLIGLAGLIFLVTPVELIASDHTRTPTQWIPYGLCGLGLLCAAVIWRAPSMRAGRMVRALLIVIGLGAAYGTLEHVEKNIAFALEIHPDLGGLELAARALGGANPLLAPGILAIGAVLALAAALSAPGSQPGPASSPAAANSPKTPANPSKSRSRSGPSRSATRY